MITAIKLKQGEINCAAKHFNSLIQDHEQTQPDYI